MLDRLGYKMRLTCSTKNRLKNNTFAKKLLALMAIAFTVGLYGCSDSSTTPVDVATKTPVDLQAHSEVFEKGVVQVTPNVHVAIGYGLANSIMIDGDNGLIIVDTMETTEEAEEVLAAFREITDKPVSAIIYTHNHADHVFGASVFAAAGEEVAIYAHDTTQYYINRVINTLRPILTTRAMRMFGSHLDHDHLVNAGIGPFLGLTKESQLMSLQPTHTFADEMEVTIEGVKLKLVHAPGETADQIYVWLPEQKVLLPGDNIYRTFPNLYTIRGTYYRDVMLWANSIDKMRLEQPEFVVPSHTRPIVGKQNVYDTLTVYRDAIQFVHDQTVRYMNQGLTPDEIVTKIKLPPHIASHAYLAEFYGTVEWSVRSIFTGYLGWFDGNSTHLFPLEPKQYNSKMIALAGGEAKLLETLQQASDNGEYQWALTLADMLEFTDSAQEAASIKAHSLRQLAAVESNPNARHYYFTQAMELENSDFAPAIFPQPQPEFVAQLPVDNIFKAMPVSLIAEDTLDVLLTAQFKLTDINKTYTIQIRNGVAEVQDYAFGEPDIEIETTAQVWKEVAAKIRNPTSALVSGDLSINKGSLKFVEFMSYFDLPDFD